MLHGLATFGRLHLLDLFTGALLDDFLGLGGALFFLKLLVDLRLGQPHIGKEIEVVVIIAFDLEFGERLLPFNFCDGLIVEIRGALVLDELALMAIVYGDVDFFVAKFGQLDSLLDQASLSLDPGISTSYLVLDFSYLNGFTTHVINDKEG